MFMVLYLRRFVKRIRVTVYYVLTIDHFPEGYSATHTPSICANHFVMLSVFK